MIRSFKDSRTEKIFTRQRVRNMADELQRAARRKLLQVDSSVRLEDLKVPPGNHLEALSGNRKGQCSIRVNRQFRICFVWKDGDAWDVEVVDYH